LLAAADQLAETLTRTDVFVDFWQARADLQEDADSRQLLDLLGTTQADLRARQKDGSVTQTDLDRLRYLQRQAGANHIIMHYAEAQQRANDYLLNVNQEISLLIGVDFGTMARSGCY
jgi:cell fate (sporulation/competence/biofilm development) regulator YlbF (YheA/YmcA/DUF963 family)